MKTLQNGAVAAALVLAALASTTAAKADLSLQGAVGLPLNPTAQIPQVDGVRVQANYSDLGDLGRSTNNKLYGLYAAGRAGDRLEINGGIEKIDGNRSASLFIPKVARLEATPFATYDFSRTGFAIGAKYLFTRESDPAGVRLAAGVGYSQVQFKNLYAYAVATKYLGEVSGDRVPVTAHLGVRYDRFDVSNSIKDSFFGVTGTKSSKVSAFAGVEVPFTRTGDFSFVGELQSKNNSFGSGNTPYSASVRFRPQGQPYAVSAGVQRRGILSNDSGLFVQLGYTFGKGAK